MENQELLRRIEALEKELNDLKSFATIPFDVESAFKSRFQNNFAPNDYLPAALVTALNSAPLTTVADPSGGVTIDSQCRTTVGTIIDRLQALGLIS